MNARGTYTLIVFFCLFAAGHGRPSPVSQSASKPEIVPRFEQRKAEANLLYSRARFYEAAALYRIGITEARQESNVGYLGRFETGLANCLLATFRYSEAMGLYLQARAHAETAGDTRTSVAVASNLAWLYIHMNDLGAAMSSVDEALRLARSLGEAEAPAGLYVSAARLHTRAGNPAAGKKLFHRAVEIAETKGDSRTVADAYDQLGYEALIVGDLSDAEIGISEAFRLRKLLRIDRDLAASYRNLGMLRIAQGDPVSALNLLAAAEDAGRRSPLTFPLWSLRYHRARAYAASGQTAEALLEFEGAVESARRWRLGALPSDAFRNQVATGLHRLYSEYIRTGIHAPDGNPELFERMWRAAEKDRAASLEQLTWTAHSNSVEYLDALEAFRTAEIRALTMPHQQEHLKSLQMRLGEIEVSLGANSALRSHQKKESITPDLALDRFKASLGETEALLSFHLRPEESYLWAVTRDSFESHIIEPEGNLRTEIEEFRNAVAADSSEAPRLGRRLFVRLFSKLSVAAQSKPDWLLSLDGALFELPFAALIDATAAGQTHLIERHSLRILPSAATPDSPRPQNSRRQFLGIGNPVYNSADSRHMGPAPGQGAMQLSSLPSSAAEVVSASKAWNNGPARTLLGRQVNRARVLEAIAEGPAVAHFATHVVQDQGSPERTMIALGLNSDGAMDFLTPSEIARSSAPVGIVVLSGCGSGRGRALPSVGLLGLTRAWLLAGSQTVAATHWPVPDDTGLMFSEFYGRLGQNNGAGVTSFSAARALQSAQISMLRSRTWRARPSLWAAYFLAARN